MEEMRQLISRRQPEITPLSRSRSIIQDDSSQRTPDSNMESGIGHLCESASDVDKLLASVVSNQEILQRDLSQVITDFRGVSITSGLIDHMMK